MDRFLGQHGEQEAEQQGAPTTQAESERKGGAGMRAAMDLLVRVQPGLRATVANAAYEYQAAQIRALASVRGE